MVNWILRCLHNLTSAPPIHNERLITRKSKYHPQHSGKNESLIHTVCNLACCPQYLIRCLLVVSEKNIYISIFQYQVNYTQLHQIPYSFDIGKCWRLQSALPGCNFVRLKQYHGPAFQMALRV